MPSTGTPRSNTACGALSVVSSYTLAWLPDGGLVKGMPYRFAGAPLVVEQIIRPTGLLDPKITLKPLRNQIDDTIIRRWQALTGGSALHGISGRSFDDLAREAEATDAA